ncbi:MAG: alginate export family protein [Alphaproteobacteria bacterium]|nr:alginate export family protein [Alphaproteobacteria bacterium]
MRECKGFALITAALLVSTSFTPAKADDIESLIKDGELYGEVRYRYENVDQEGIAEDASANTVRTNLGFKTGEYNGLKGAVELQFVQHLGDEDYNSTTNGQTSFPVVADPDVTEVNEFWLAYGIPVGDTEVKVGRQKINLDNQRFVGTVGWRQNDQTFDGVQVSNSAIENLDILYNYVGNVNRINGNDHASGDLDSHIHLVNASYKVADWLKASVYGYWMDFKQSAALSNRTYGVRATGDIPLSDDWTFFYEAEAAAQEDYANNTADYDEKYYHIAPGIKGHGITLQAGYEVLGSDGTNSFRTPLATLHKFNGWADKFLTTPATGLEDTYAMASYKFSGMGNFLDGTNVTAFYHDFSGDTSGNFGSEFDLSVGKSFKISDDLKPFKNVGVTLKYADYNAEDAPYTDTEKFWLQFLVKF